MVAGSPFKLKDLDITWGDDSRYWKINEGDGPAELLQVCWLEVKGSTKVKKGHKYLVKFKLSLKKENSGWEVSPVYIMAKIGENGEDQLSKPIKLSDELHPDEEAKEIPVGDKKFEIQFEAEDPKSKSKDTLFFGLYEVWECNWKSGLVVHEAIVEELPPDHSASTSKNNPPGGH